MNKRENWVAVFGLALASLAGGASEKHARADAPSGRYTITADTARDNRTGLTWQRSPNDSLMVYSFTQIQYLDAASYCLDLSLAGFDDWRLPTIVELLSIVDDGRSQPAMDPLVFPGDGSGTSGTDPVQVLWSSSPVVNSGDRYWLLGVRTGTLYDRASATTEVTFAVLGVRCVR